MSKPTAQARRLVLWSLVYALVFGPLAPLLPASATRQARADNGLKAIVYEQQQQHDFGGYPVRVPATAAGTLDGMVLKFDGTAKQWVAGTGGGGGAPTGPAGGDLGGTYPNPTVLSLVHVTSGTTNALDVISSTRGALLERGAASWGAIIPGTSGFVLVSNGPGTDPTYQTPPSSPTTSPWATVLGNGATSSGHNPQITTGDLLRFGGATASFTALKPSGTTLAVRSGDDSIDGALSAGNLAILGGTVTVSTPPVVVSQTWNNAGTIFTGVHIAVTRTAADFRSTVLLVDGGAISCPGVTGVENELFGARTTSGGSANTVIGWQSNASGTSDVVLGHNCSIGNVNGTIIVGDSITTNMSESLIVATASTASAAGSNMVMLGNQITAGATPSSTAWIGVISTAGNEPNATNQFAIGTDTTPYTKFLLGSGRSSATTGTVNVQGTNGKGAGIAGWGLNLSGGISGDAATAGGLVTIQTALAGTGTALTTAATFGGATYALDVVGATRVTGKLTVTGAIDPTSVSLSSGTALFFDSADGSTAPVSGVNHGRIRYLDGTGWQVSSNGGAYATLSTNGTSSLQSAYNGGATITEAGAVPVALSSTTADNGDVLTVNKAPGSSHSGNGITITMGANSNGSASGINATTSGDAYAGSFTSTSTGGAIFASIGTASNSINPTLDARDSAASNANVAEFTKNPSGGRAGSGLLITMGGGGGLTSGAGLNVTMTTGQASGSAISLTGGTVTTSAPLVTATQTWNAGGVTFNGMLINITSTASAAGSTFFDFQLASVSALSLTKAAQLTWGAGLGGNTHILGPSDTSFNITGGLNQFISITKNGAPPTNVSLAINSGRLFAIDGIYVRTSTSSAGGFPAAGGMALESALGFYNGAGGAATIDIGVSRVNGNIIGIGNGTAGDVSKFLQATGAAFNDSTTSGVDIGFSSTGAIQMGSAVNFAWTNGTNGGGTKDANVSRLAASSLAFGNGTASDVTATLNFSAAVMGGKVTKYNGVSTAGAGVVPVYGIDFRQGVTSADGAATTLYTAVNGTSVFRITADIFATAVTSGTATYTVTWTQNSTTQTMVVSSTVINTLATATDLINPDNGTAITAKLTGTFSQTVTITALVEQLK